jgi:uncharacterized protein (DUF1800 family)
MDKELAKIDPAWAWRRYRPSAEMPWDARRVGHLYRRATFGATYTQLQEGVKAGPEAVLEHLFKGGPGLADFDSQMEALGRTIAQANSGSQLRGWWVARMLYSPYPLQEKLTLFWHNHFATSYAKVQSARYMLGQYALMRRHALGSFAGLLQEMSRDPAMMVWLDTRDSKKGNPNENYARELMELFSLGRGHYTEKDIREAARAFTGWEIKDDAAAFNKDQHDDGEKKVLGRTGKFKGEDIVRICLDQPACGPFIVGKLYRFLVSETASPPPELIAPLARQFRESGWDFGALVRTVLSSNLFFSSHAYRARVKSPVDFALGIVHGLEGRVGALALSQALEELGQGVFYPPSVKGWDGGPAWLNGQTLLFRQNLSGALTSTEDSRFGRRTDPAALARKYGKQGDEEAVDFFLTLFLDGDVPADARQRLVGYERQSRSQSFPAYWTSQDVADHRVRSLCHLVLTLPEFQLG